MFKHSNNWFTPPLSCISNFNKPLIKKARKGRPQPTEKRTEKRWTISGQPVQDTGKKGSREEKDVGITKTIERGGGRNQLLLFLNNNKSIKPFLNFLKVTINIIQHIDDINNEHQSHVRYIQRQFFMRKPIKGENLFFFEMIGSLLSSVHHL